MEVLCLWWANGWMQTLLMLNQILRWLKKPKVLRPLCLASSIVGLVCYALSSSFNHLLGNWSWWKILIYIVFSFIICLAVLFTPARSSSTSLRLEAHLAFLVLIITSVYSFLFDNEVKVKPDEYSLISSAAFATMSLGLSNLTQFGFQIDLLYFFCGDLIVQLMKIKLWLVIVGGAFSYSFFQLRDTPHHTQAENFLLPIQNPVIILVDDLEIVSNSGHATVMSQQANARSPEDGDLRFQDHLLTQSNSHPQDDGLIIQQQLMNCIEELEKENQMVVPIVCSHVEKYLKGVFDSKDKDEDQNEMREVPQPDVNLAMDTLPSGIMRRFKEIVKLMVEAGLEEECIEIYSKWRREFVKQCVPNEGRLCYFLFSGFSDAANVSFDKVYKELSIALVSFADTAITTGSYLPNLSFKFVPKMFESLKELRLGFNVLKDFVKILANLKRSRDKIYPTIVQAPVTDGEPQILMHYFLPSSEHIRTVVIIESLESEWEAESKEHYTHPASRTVFLVLDDLNFDYDLLGSWKKLMDFLNLKTNESAKPDVAAELTKDKLD